jgi:uncharacterized protein YhfF
MTENEMWSAFTDENPIFKNKGYDAWCFGGGAESANVLAKLVYDKTKTATTSAFELYEIENIPLPPIGGLNIILDANNNAICITETTKVYVCRYSEVSEEHAFMEGEGDQSLEYWKRVHKDFFTIEMNEIDKLFDEEMRVVCEEFKAIYR